MDSAVSLLSVLPILLVPAVVSADVCFWSGSCMNKWLGGCGTGRVMVDQSQDCHGLCPQPHYRPCLPFLTHLQCCNEETPISSDECARCGNRVDVGNHWMCCSDCSEAMVGNYESKTGFCRSGAQLSIQPMAREVVRWITRDWTPCSRTCGGGTKHRSVRCVGSLEHSPQQLYYVNDTRCESSRKPLSEESCNTKPCSHKEYHNQHAQNSREGRHHSKRHRRRLPVWAILFISLLTMSAMGGLAFGGYTFYNRRRNAEHGFVYVMLDSYS